MTIKIDNEKTKKRALQRKKYRLHHESKSIRTMTNRKFRRGDRLRVRLTEEPVNPSSKEYKTGGWISW